MKNYRNLLVVALIFGLSFGVASIANAQVEDPAPPPSGPYGNGNGMMGGRSGNENGMMSGNYEDGLSGPMHEEMITFVSSVLNVSEEEIESKLESGMTIFDVVSEYGMPYEEFQTLMFAERGELMNDFQYGEGFGHRSSDRMLEKMQWNSDSEGFQGHGNCGSLEIEE